MSTQALEVRMSRIEGAFEQVNERLSGIERRLDGMDGRFGLMDQRFAQIDQRFNWVIGTILASWITTILTVLFHH